MITNRRAHELAMKHPHASNPHRDAFTRTGEITDPEALIQDLTNHALSQGGVDGEFWALIDYVAQTPRRAAVPGWADGPAERLILP